MEKYVVLYNPNSGNGLGAKAAEELKGKLPDCALRFENITAVKDYAEFFASLTDEKPIIVGGDGTINHLVNHYDCDHTETDIYYYPAGTGNDFLTDIKTEETTLPLLLNPYIKNLPVVTVKGVNYKVLNGIGFGIDGYCCEVGDQLRQTSTKPVNYAGIAIKGLLFHFKPVNAKIVVDGVEHNYRKCWLAPTMNGRFYGGGMNATPAQDRSDPKRTLSTLIFHGSGKLKTLMIFPNIFKGTHVEHKDNVEVLTGHDITVTFDKPVAAQVDGETILAVTEYHITKN